MCFKDISNYNLKGFYPILYICYRAFSQAVSPDPEECLEPS